MTKNTALVLIDFVNEIASSDGKLSKKGYYDFIARHHTADALERLLAGARANSWLICHVRVGFSPNYVDHPTRSPLFGGAKKFGALRQGEWGTEFASIASPMPDEPIVQKCRVSAFYNTNLGTILGSNQVDTLCIAGVATDLAVEAAARDAHDRDFRVFVIADACAAASDDEHNNALSTIRKIGVVTTTDRIMDDLDSM